MERIQLHQSALSLFGRCGEAFRRRYIEGEVRPPAAYLIVGRGTDAAVNADLTSKLKRGELLSAKEIEDIAAGVVERDFREPVDMRGDKVSKGSARDLAIHRTVKFAGFAHRVLVPTIRPKAIQRAWSVRLDSFLEKRDVTGMAIDYVGMMDIEEWVFDFGPKECDEAHTAIRDLKTSGKSPDANAVDGKHDIQLTSYALGKKVEDGIMPDRVQVDYLVDLKRGIEHKTVTGTRDNYNLAALFNQIEIRARMLKAGIFPPAPRDHWCCTEKWCGYYSTCPYVKNKHTLDLSVPSPTLYRIGPAPIERTKTHGRKKAQRETGIHLVQRGSELDPTDD